MQLLVKQKFDFSNNENSFQELYTYRNLNGTIRKIIMQMMIFVIV